MHGTGPRIEFAALPGVGILDCYGTGIDGAEQEFTILLVVRLRFGGIVAHAWFAPD